MVFENAQEREATWHVDRSGNFTDTGAPEQQVSYEPNQSVPNCGTITVQKEDHTIANLLRQQLLTQDEVRFAGYQMPHPLEHKFLLRVETTGPEATPLGAIEKSFDMLLLEFQQIQQRFDEEVRKRKQQGGDVFE
jgi:DNA-directed RNA polymerase II subunit RPB11